MRNLRTAALFVARFFALFLAGLGALARPAAAYEAAMCPPGTRPMTSSPPANILKTWCARPDRRSLGIWGLEAMCAQPPITRSFGVTQWCERSDRADHVRHGPFMDFYASGDVQQVGQYRDGTMDGLWVRWMDGVPRRKAWEEEYRDGKPHGRLASWHENGARFQEGGFQQGRREGHWTTWFPDGKKSEEGDYVADQPNGPWTYFHPGGQLKQKGAFDHGAHVGVWRTYHASGARKSEGAYARGAPDGPWTLWWENGTTAATGAYAAGKRAPPWTWWHPDGSTAAPEQCRYEMLSPDTIGRCMAVFVADPHAPPPKLVASPPPRFEPAKALSADVQCRCREAPSARLTWTPAEPRGLGQRIEIARAGNPGFTAPGLVSAELSPFAGGADLRQADQRLIWRVLTRVAGGWVPGPSHTAVAGCYPCDMVEGAPRPGPQPGPPRPRP